TQSSTAGATAPAATTPTTPPNATTTPSATAPTEKAVKPARMSRNAAKARGSRNEVRHAQEQLKSEGLYRGRIDGRMGHQMRIALSRFQQHNGLHRTAALDRMTVNRLLGSRTTGFGSSAPAKPTMTRSHTGAGGDNAMNRSNVKGY